MQIQVNTDENIEGGVELSARVSAEIRARLDRFSKHITRIEVHISDENGDKSGESDKRCARPTPRWSAIPPKPATRF